MLFRYVEDFLFQFLELDYFLFSFDIIYLIFGEGGEFYEDCLWFFFGFEINFFFLNLVEVWEEEIMRVV